jgi:TonB family protein
MVNTVIGNWKIERKLGQGGMGEVYLARHSYLGTLAALKILSTSLTGEPKFRERFFQEAQMQAQLIHPHIARVIDFIEQDGLFCQVVEYVSGGTAADAIRARGALPVSLALRWTKQILSALQCAHLKGIVHRDIKPSNILLEQGGDAKLTDFGIAMATGRDRLTTVGKSIGTPEYMSPEQISTPKEVDERSDIYSVGIALFEFLTGRVPFESDSDFEIYQAQLHDPPPNIRPLNPSVPKQLEDIVRKALKKKPAARYESCAQFLDAIQEFERRVPIEGVPLTRLAGQHRTRPRFRVSAGLALVVFSVTAILIGATVLYLWAQSASRKKQSGSQVESSNPTALSGSESSSTNSPGGSGTEPVKDVSRLSGGTSSVDIRKFDFLNFTYPLSPEYEENEFGKTATVSHGKFFKSRPTSAEAVPDFSVGKVLYGDLTGEGQDEAVIWGVYYMGCYWDREVFIYKMEGEHPKLIGKITSKDMDKDYERQKPPNSDPYGLWPEGDLRLGSGFVIVERATGGSHAGPTYTAVLKYRWNGTRFELSGKPVLRKINYKNYKEEEDSNSSSPSPPAPPEKKDEPPKIIRKAGGVMQGTAIRRVEPTFPPLAKAARVSGSVVVEVTVDEQGNVISARAISGHPLLSDAAVSAARGWKFAPSTLAGEPVKVIGTLTFNFNL